MKYASLILIIIGLIVSIFSLFSFQIINSAHYLAAVMRLFSSASIAAEFREHSPFEITNQLSTYFYQRKLVFNRKFDGVKTNENGVEMLVLQAL